ncbi:MAG: SLC13 family permease [Gammaproteobacteria bacterium]|nr:MAG: SLC13 family permease [Gammaproteobacteria bacterium]
MLMPAMPNNHAIAVMILTVFALWLFRKDTIPLETSSLVILVILAMTFALFPFHKENVELEAIDFFFGFGHEAMIAVCGLMIAGQGLVRTGALEPIGRQLAKLWRISPLISLLITLIIAAILSAFVNNTPIVVLLLPILISVSIRTKTDSSGLLMPMGMATIIGGMSTSIGTSTNLLVISVAADLTGNRMGMFDFAYPASIAAGIGIIYLWLIAPKLLPSRSPQLTDIKPRLFAAQLDVLEDGFSDGKTLHEIISKTDNLMKVRGIKRGTDRNLMTMPDITIKAGDRLRVQDTPENLKEFEKVLGCALFSKGAPVDDDNPLQAKEQQLAEIVIISGSPLVNTTLGQINFAKRFEVTTVALHRAGSAVDIRRRGLGSVVLQVGDVLLVQGTSDQITHLKQGGEVLVLDATTNLPHTKKAPVALAIMAGIVTIAATGIMPIGISALSGVVLMLLTGCMKWKDAALGLSIPVVMIIAVSLALGLALEKTGGALFLGEYYVYLTAGMQPIFILSGLMLLLAFMTNVISNNAAAVIGTPIAIAVANSLQLDVEPFILAVLFGANMSYATPMAYKTNLLVMNAGGYKFSDFMRIGIPLILLMWISFTIILANIYDLTPPT